MSYDLFFRARRPRATITCDEFVAYFERCRHFSVERGEGGFADAFYSNADTGVYFRFDFDPRRMEDGDGEFIVDLPQEPEPCSMLPIAFNLNYYRPHSFGIEAEPHVKAFVAAFDLTVVDFQTYGMGEGEYSTEGLSRGWNAGNEFGYRGVTRGDLTCAEPTLPAAKIAAVWRWNYEREAIQSRLRDGVFVLVIFFVDCEDDVATAVAWLDGFPIVLPRVNMIVVGRRTLAPRRWYGVRKEDSAILWWDELEPLLDGFKRQRSPDSLERNELFYANIPREIERLIRGASRLTSPLAVRAFDHVLDREILETVCQNPQGLS